MLKQADALAEKRDPGPISQRRERNAKIVADFKAAVERGEHWSSKVCAQAMGINPCVVNDVLRETRRQLGCSGKDLSRVKAVFGQDALNSLYTEYRILRRGRMWDRLLRPMLAKKYGVSDKTARFAMTGFANRYANEVGNQPTTPAEHDAARALIAELKQFVYAAENKEAAE